MPNLSIKIGNTTFKNPVTVASGTFGHAEKYFNLEEVKKLGAIVPKTVTLLPQVGNPPVRIWETPSGMINAIGIENPGIDVFIEKKLPSFKKIGVPLIVSVLGHNPEQFVSIIEKLNSQDGIAAIELNLSCPNLGHKTLMAQDAKATEALLKKVTSISKFPVIAKLSPNVTDISEIAQGAEAGGADAVSLINTLTAMAIDIRTRKSRIGNFTGGLSGPAIRPVAVAMVHKVYQAVKIPIIGMGGIAKAEDALEFIIAGATMVATGTINFVNPRASLEVLEGITAYMKEQKISDIKDLIGCLQK
ncbi:MAG: dihydroorotate dehydrogenase [Candidatus Omnitrophica bacterium]|nr:dihydroorotate dehydrogenase [Candidatus Omnitrophota bacterium]